MAAGERGRARALAPAFFALAFGAVAAYAMVPALFPGSVLAITSRLTFASLCHQEPGRSFVLDGHALAVCHRCAGIYFGIPAGALLAYVLRVDPARYQTWILGGVPMLLQVVAAWIFPALDLWPLRVATGLFAGGIGGLLLARATQA